MKKILTVVSGAILVLGTGNATASSVVIGTGADGGGYDGTICEGAIQGPAQESGVSVTCMSSKGSIENMKSVNAGDVDAGITQTDLLYKAWEEGAEWADNLNPGGRSFTTESLLCFTAGGKVNGMKQFTEPKLNAEKWKIITPEVDSGSEGSVTFFVNMVPGYAENVEIIPMEEWDVNKAIGRLTSRNKKKQADAACFVGLPDPTGNKNIKVVSANKNLSWIPMDDNRALQLEFSDEVVYPAISAVPVTGGIMTFLAGTTETVDALQIPVTYVYNDDITQEALEMLAALIDQNPNFLKDSGIMGKIMTKISEGKDFSMAVADRFKK